MLDRAKIFLGGLIDIGLILITISVVFQAVFGSVIPFVGGDVVYNLMSVLSQFGDTGLVGLIGVAIFYYLLKDHVS
tara:strand:- start:368 stop:595 length:228 start_codon:yes stop_codon:yes gene_type:complete